MVRKLNLNHLYSLDAILNATSLTEAGRQVRLSQPAMSIALRKLRDQFEDELVTYVGAERRLTPLAQALRPKVRQILRDVDDTFYLRLDFDPARASRSFTIAAPEALEIMLLGRVLPILLREAPGIDINVQPFTHGSAVRAFELGADVLVVPERFGDPELDRMELMTEKPACMVSNDHPGIGDHMTAEQYLTARHVALDDRPWPVSHLDAASQDLLRRRDVVVTTSRHAALPGLIAGTGLIATAGGWLLQYFASMMPLKIVPFPLETPPEPIIAQWPAARKDDAALRWLRERLAEATSPFG